MKTLLRFSSVGLIFASVAHAHPGHDGHELVWNYNGGHVHLDWMIWTMLVGLAAVSLYRYITHRE
jgi:hypothetical protein